MRLIDADYMRLQVDMIGTNKYGMLDENIRVFIDQQPTVEPEQRTGKWLNECMDYGECSECGFCGLTTDYCPSCGARMNNE